ncbi:hypothetical protein JCM15579A_11720 [Marinifilum fragile]|jgi:hypothetical protein
MSTIIIILAQIIEATATISAIRVKGYDHFALASLRMELIKEPTKLTATKNTKLDMYIPQEV